jgi:5-methylcytosine-specific restriction endonuclease McrA
MSLPRAGVVMGHGKHGPVFQDGANRTTARSRVYTHDKRYGTARWRKLRLRVLQRDAYRCRIVPDCPHPATVADHIEPVHAGMPDALFFDPRNLRAACRGHNIDRGKVARFLRETGGVG